MSLAKKLHKQDPLFVEVQDFHDETFYNLKNTVLSQQDDKPSSIIRFSSTNNIKTEDILSILTTDVLFTPIYVKRLALHGWNTINAAIIL